MRQKRTILCVDDHEPSLSIRKVMLETRGYRVILATSASEALSVFEAHLDGINGVQPIDLVLSDYLMPDMDGAEMIRQMKLMSPLTPCILFSGKIKAFDGNQPADLFVAKGEYVPSELLDRIRQLVVKKRGPKPASIIAMMARRTQSREASGIAAS